MGRTRAAGNNAPNAVRDGATYRAGAGKNGAARSAPASGPRHILGISAVVAVFALVGLTLWRPLSVLITVPVIAVLALIVRTAVPVPALGRSGAGARARRPASQGGGSATAPRGSSTGSRGSSTGPRDAARRPAGAGRYDDMPPYDQEADPAATSMTRRPARPAADRERPATARYERDDARRPRQPELETPPRRSAAGPGAARYGDRDDNRRTPAEDPRYAGSRSREAARDRSRDRQPDAADYPAYGSTGPRAAGGRDGYDHAFPAGQDTRRPASRGSSTGPRYPQDAADEWRYTGRHPGAGPDPRAPGASDRQDPQEEYDGHDEYGNELYASDRGDSRAVQVGRWRGWRQPDWDDDAEPEPEPDEDMMHTMALDMRGYLDDTGSFRMP